jgi:hypothetical protein
LKDFAMTITNSAVQRLLLTTALLAPLALVQGCMTSGSNTVISDRGQYQRGPISEVEAETLQNQLNEAVTQRDAAVAALPNVTNPDTRRKVQQSIYDYNQLISLYQGRLRSAGRPVAR